MFDEYMVRVGCVIRQIGTIAGIGQRVQDHHAAVARHRMPHEVGADEAGAARDENSMSDHGGLPLPQPQEKQRSEEHTSELQSLMRISYAVFCLKKKKTTQR